MKIFYQIIIIIISLSSLFIIKDDLKSAYDNNTLSIKSSIEEILKKKDVLLSSLNYSSPLNKYSENINSKDDINLSGPLKVINDLISKKNGDTKLSKENIIELTNQSRNDNGGLQALKENSKLDFSAEKKLQDMFTKQYFEHESPSGVGVGDLGKEVSYEYITIGENLAMGNFKDDKSLVDAWMASAGHRANILNKKYLEIGVAVGKGVFEGKEVWMSVQHFGLPKSVCPKIDEVLHDIIDLNQDEINKTGNRLSVLKTNIEKGSLFEGKTISEQIDSYNFSIINYNNLISDIKQKIIEYNDQVNAFNSCINLKSS